jgi:hypothetical protein
MDVRAMTQCLMILDPPVQSGCAQDTNSRRLELHLRNKNLLAVNGALCNLERTLDVSTCSLSQIIV